MRKKGSKDTNEEYREHWGDILINQSVISVGKPAGWPTCVITSGKGPHFATALTFLTVY